MKALIKKEAAEGLWLAEVPMPTIGDRDVLIRIRKTSICGTDVHINKWDAWAQRTIKIGGEQANLTDTEARLALLLFTNIDRTLSRNHIFALAWGRTTLQMTRTIDTHISRLRLKLGLHEDNGVRLRAVYNVGYRLERIAHQGIDQLTDPMRPLALQA